MGKIPWWQARPNRPERYVGDEVGYAQTSGQHAEDLACEYLAKQGLHIIARNYRTRLGEIDLVMRDRETTVFVEVRFRRHTHIVDPLSSIDRRKQQKLVRTARYYLQTQGVSEHSPARFDVIAVTEDNTEYQIQWIKNAFEPQES